MKLPKLSKSRPSSANVSPVSTPRAHGSPTSKLPSPLSPDSPHSSKPANKSFWPEKGKSLQLRLPSLSRSRSRGSKTTSDEASPIALRSPLGKSNSNKSLLDSNQTQGAASSLQAIRAARAQDGKHTSMESSHDGNISDPLVEEIKHVFEKFDTNGDGKISAEELCCVLRSLGDNTTQEEAELMVAEVDMDKDGFIDLQEFINLNTRAAVGGVNGEQRWTGSNVTDELAAAFDVFDLDKNGCITPDELHCVLRNLGNRTSTLEDCKRMISGVDRKGYGHVDFDDFKIMLTSNTSIMA